MSTTGWWIGGATLASAIGMWLLLPRGRAGGQWLGGLFGVIGLALFASQLTSLGDWLSDSVFAILAGVTVGAGVATVTFRNPVYCAVWFALCLLGSAGMFFFQGAQFLGVATVVVYAGAILVTLLFVLMLANPQGHAPYDRRSWEAPLSATAGMVMVGILTLTIVGSLRPSTPLLRNEVIAAMAAMEPAADDAPAILPEQVRQVRLAETDAGLVLRLELVGGLEQRVDANALQRRLTAEVPRLREGFTLELAAADDVLQEHHVARLGSLLFSRHLIAVEAASVLLLAALVGATAIVIHSRIGEQRAAALAEAAAAGDEKGGARG